MNATLCRNTEMELLRCDQQKRGEDIYATAPIVAVKPTEERIAEEELYTLFEEAISDRVVAVKGRLQRLSQTNLTVACGNTQLQQPVAAAQGMRTKRSIGATLQTWQRTLITLCFALGCIFIGFDLMGLLVLYAR